MNLFSSRHAGACVLSLLMASGCASSALLSPPAPTGGGPAVASRLTEAIRSPSSASPATESACPPPPACDFGTFRHTAEEERSFTNVAVNARSLDGNHVRARGFIQLDFEAHHLAASRQDFQLEWQNTVIYSVRMTPALEARDLGRACTRKDVIVEGTFHEGPRTPDGRYMRGIPGTLWLTAIRELKPENLWSGRRVGFGRRRASPPAPLQRRGEGEIRAKNPRCPPSPRYPLHLLERGRG